MSGSDTNSSSSDRSVYPQSSPATSLSTASTASSISQSSLSSITGTTGPSSSVTSCPGTHCSGCPSRQSISSKSKGTSRKKTKKSGKKKHDSKKERKGRRKVKKGSPAVKRVSFADPLETSDSELHKSETEQMRASPIRSPSPRRSASPKSSSRGRGSRPRRIRSTQSRERTNSSNSAPVPHSNSNPHETVNENRTNIVATVPSQETKRTRLPYTPPRTPSYENILRGSSASKSPEKSSRSRKRSLGSPMPKQHRPTDSPSAPGPSTNSSSNQNTFVMRSRKIKTIPVPMPPADSSGSNTKPAEELREDEALPPTGPSFLIRTWNLVEVDMNTRNIKVRLYTLLTMKEADNEEIEKALRSGKMNTVQGKMVTREEKQQLGRVEFSVGQGEGFVLIERQYEENNETVEAQRKEKYEKFCSVPLEKGEEQSLRLSISLSHQSNEDRDVISRRDQILIHLGNGPLPDFDTHWELNPENVGDVFMDENVQELQNSILVTRMIGIHQKNVRDPEYMGRQENWSQWQRNVYLIRYPLNGSSVFLVDNYTNHQRVWGHPLTDYIPHVTLQPIAQQNFVPVVLPVRPPTPAAPRSHSADFLELLADAPMPDDPPFIAPLGLAPLGPAAINDLMSDFPEEGEDLQTQQHLWNYYGQQNAQDQDQNEAAEYNQPLQDFGAQPQQNLFYQNQGMDYNQQVQDFGAQQNAFHQNQNYGQQFQGFGAQPQQNIGYQQMNQGNQGNLATQSGQRSIDDIIRSNPHIPARFNPYQYRGLFYKGQVPQPEQQQQPQNQQYYQPQTPMQTYQQQQTQQQQYQSVQPHQQRYQPPPQQHQQQQQTQQQQYQQQPQYVTDQNDGTVFVDPSQPGTSGNHDYSGAEGQRGRNSSPNESSRGSTPILTSGNKNSGTKTVSKTMKRKKGSISSRKKKKGVKSDVRTRSTQSSNSVSSQRKKKASGTVIVAKVPGKKENCQVISGIETKPSGHFVIYSPWDEPKVLPLDIVNHGPSTVAWSLKTTRPQLFETNCPNGILKAGESMRIFVNFAGFIPGEEPKRSDRLTLMWTDVTENTVFSRRLFDNDSVTTKKVLHVEYY